MFRSYLIWLSRQKEQAMFEFTYILDSGSKRCGRGGDIREAPLRSKRREEMDREETGC
jgi:hypothetical protein